MIHRNCMVLLTTPLRGIGYAHFTKMPRLRQRNVSFSNFKQKVCFATATKKETRNVKIPRTRHTKVQKYLEEFNPEVMAIAPDRLMKLSAPTIEGLHVVNHEIAEEVTRLIMDDLSKNMSFVIELNSGTGVLTEKLLNAGVPFVHMSEENVEFHPTLNTLITKFPNRLDLRKINLFKIARIKYRDEREDTTEVEEALKDVEVMKWSDKTCMQIIGATNDHIFIRHLILSIVFKNCFMVYGRPVFYLAMKSDLWGKYMRNGLLPTTASVMFQILFNWKFLGIVNRMAFLPWERRQSRKTRIIPGNEMCVVQIEPKRDLYAQSLNKEILIQFWYFVRHYIGKGRKRIIPELEKIIPGCGPKLIMKNYTIFTEFSDLLPEELLNLFCEFQSWPEFENSHFKSSLKTFYESDGLLLNIEDNFDAEENSSSSEMSNTTYADDLEPQICTEDEAR